MWSRSRGLAGISGCRCSLIWIWMRGIGSRWIWKEGTTNMQTEQLEDEGLWWWKSSTLTRLKEIHRATCREWKRTESSICTCSSHFPLLGAQTEVTCSAQLHMKQCGRGLWQRQAICSVLINPGSHCSSSSSNSLSFFLFKTLWEIVLSLFLAKSWDENIITPLSWDLTAICFVQILTETPCLA